MGVILFPELNQDFVRVALRIIESFNDAVLNQFYEIRGIDTIENRFYFIRVVCVIH